MSGRVPRLPSLGLIYTTIQRFASANRITSIGGQQDTRLEESCRVPGWANCAGSGDYLQIAKDPSSMRGVLPTRGCSVGPGVIDTGGFATVRSNQKKADTKSSKG
jgi:hypothetical protein